MTTFEQIGPDELFELRVLVLAALSNPRLTWRHHGLGALQAYLREDPTGKAETRIHVYHWTLMLMDGPRRIHDHRFRLRSTVLLGTIEHEEPLLVPEAKALPVSREQGVFQMFNVRHARVQGDVKPELADETRWCIEGSHSRLMFCGDRYTFDPRYFHRTGFGDGYSITLVTKLNQTEAPARVLARAGEVPDHGFAKQIDAPAMQRILDDAQAELRAALRRQ